MKKGCLIVIIVLAVLLALLAAGVFVAYRIGDQRMGLSQAPVISHEQAVKGDTRIRFVISPEKLAPFIAAYLPPKMQEAVARFMNAEDALSMVLPREIALLARSDILGKNMGLTLFANEKYLGRMIQERVNGSEFFSNIPQINWTTNGFELPERGFLYAEGNLPFPDSVEEDLNKLWPVAAKEPAAAAEGTSQAELVIDNRNGDILAVAGALVQASGQDWNLLKENQYGRTAIGIMESIHIGRLKADMMDMDTAAIQLRIDSDAEKGPGLQFLLSGLALPYLREHIKKNYALVLEGELPWNAGENAIIGSFKLTGLKPFLQSRLAQMQ